MSAIEACPSHPTSVLIRIELPWHEAVELVVVFVPPIKRACLDVATGPVVLAMIENRQTGLQIFRLIDVEGRVQIPPTEELGLIAKKKIGLTIGVSRLQTPGVTIKLAVPVGNRPIGSRMIQLRIESDRALSKFPRTHPSLVKTLAIQVIRSTSDAHLTACFDWPPAVVHRTDIRMESAYCLVRTRQNPGRTDHRRSNGNLCEIVSGL